MAADHRTMAPGVELTADPERTRLAAAVIAVVTVAAAEGEIEGSRACRPHLKADAKENANEPSTWVPSADRRRAGTRASADVSFRSGRHRTARHRSHRHSARHRRWRLDSVVQRERSHRLDDQVREA